MRKEIKEGITGKTVQSVDIFFGSEGSDGLEIKFQDATGLFISLKERDLELEAVELRSWKEGEGRLLKKFV